MPKIVNSIVKAKLKKSLMSGMDAKNACLNAGLAPMTAHNATAHKVVISCQEEIRQELKAADVSVEWLLGEYREAQTLAKSKGDIATFKATIDSIAKYISQIPDRSIITNNQEEQLELDGLRSRYRLC